MQNFKYYTPTRLFFGKNSIQNLPAILAPLGKKVLVTYGGGSIKRIGLYEKVMELLKGFEVYEFGGIEPNPKYTKDVLGGVSACKEHGIEVVLSVGGGSVLDCSKAICAGALYDGEPWDLITGKAKAQSALPLVDILTLAATGSEYDNGGVISRPETQDKICYKDDLIFPYASILDPEYTFSVPYNQTAAGAVDAISHVMEQYFCGDSSLLTDGMCEATVKSLMNYVQIALREPENYQARAELMLCSTLACNGILSLGNAPGGWPCHAIEHALSGFYDITHGEGLAIITPVWMRYVLSEQTLPRFVRFGINVFGIDESLSEMQIANEAIDRTYAFFKSLGMPMTLREVGIDGQRIDEMARHVAQTEGLENAWPPLYEGDISEIIKRSL